MAGLNIKKNRTLFVGISSLIMIMVMMQFTTGSGALIGDDPFPDPGPITVTIKVHGYVYDKDVYNAGYSIKDPVVGASVSVYIGGDVGTRTTTTNSNGYYSVYFYVPQKDMYAVGRVTVSKWGYYTNSQETFTAHTDQSRTYSENVYLDDRGNKYAIFLYQGTDKGGYLGSNILADYNSQLSKRGYSITNYKNPSSWTSAMNTLDNRESLYDKVFIYVCGHGGYVDPWIGEDYSYINLGSSTVRSRDFDNYVVNLESERITIITEGCKSGDFQHNLAPITGVTILTSADETHNSYYWDRSGTDNDEPCMSDDFFYKIKYGYSISEAISYARSGNSGPNPLLSWGARSFDYF